MRTEIEDAPWPVVRECYGHKGTACCQCDGSHDHRWTAWHEATWGGSRVPVRCGICGARKCDVPACTSRRHHRDHHVLLDGTFERVGG